jgi:hypothetical protein
LGLSNLQAACFLKFSLNNLLTGVVVKTLRINLEESVLEEVLRLLKTMPQEAYRVEEIYDFEQEISALEQTIDFDNEAEAARFFTFLRKGLLPEWRQEYIDTFFREMPQNSKYQNHTSP